MSATSWLLLNGGGGARPPVPPIARSPLPAFPPGSYRRVLPWVPPVHRDFLRADSWGVTLPGAPAVEGIPVNPPMSDRMLSWFIDRYPMEWQRFYLRTYGGYGYTHFKLSYPDSVAAGQTLDQFVRTCLRVKEYVPYAQVVLGSKYYNPHYMSAQEWADYSDPIIDTLAAAKAMDECILGWEWDLWTDSGKVAQPPLERPTIATFKHAGQRCHEHGISFWMHFSSEYTSWFADGDGRGRFGFYSDLGTDVDGINYQTQPKWSESELQARIVDSLWQFGQEGNIHKFRMDEDQASLMYANPTPDENWANLRGYISCCAVDDVKWTNAKCWGFGNGGRMPDGSRI